MSDDALSDWKEACRRLFLNMASDFKGARQFVDDVSRIYYEELTRAFEGPLNAHLSKLPQDAYEEKQALSISCNHELHTLGLAIRCPTTGDAAILVADTRGQGDDTARFRLKTRNSRGRQHKTYTSERLPRIELMREPPRREGRSKGDRFSER